VTEFRGKPRAKSRRFAIVISRFNENITDRLLAGALACLEEHGIKERDVDVASVPGAWELPHAAQRMAERGVYDAIIALGCVIEGETRHFDYIAGPAATGLARVALDARLPVTFGVLTTNDVEQAMVRAGGRLGNKGWDAALAALELADLDRQLERPGESA
jgi:6,7-dimethyl-8-ribityllumazine synthase